MVHVCLHFTVDFYLKKCDEDDRFSQIITPEICKLQLYFQQDGVVAKVFLCGVLLVLFSTNVISSTCINSIGLPHV